MTEARIELPPPEPKRCNCAAHSAAECVCGAWEEGPSRDQLEKALAECRDAFPIPPPGAPHEHAWGAAMGDPLSVPHYVRAAIAAVGVPPSNEARPLVARDFESVRAAKVATDKKLEFFNSMVADTDGAALPACAFCNGTGTALLTGPGGGYGTCPDFHGTGKSKRGRASPSP